MSGKPKQSRFEGIISAFDNAREWYSRLDFLIKILSAFGVLVLLGAGGFGIITVTGRVTVDFNTIAGCRRGSLSELKNNIGVFSDEVTLQSGSAELRICDTQSLTASISNFAERLADRYPGCIRYDDVRDELHMPLNKAAICRHTTGQGTRYFCDGSSRDARERPSFNQLVQSTAGLSVCVATFFEPNNAPDDI